MKYIGAHIDCIPDLSHTPAKASALGARAFALNLVNPAKWRSPEWPDDVVREFRRNCELFGYSPNHILPHARFVINLGSPEPQKLHLSRIAMVEEMNRCSRLGLTLLNFHPGAHLKKISEDESVARVASTLNRVLEETQGVTAVIENTAGSGSTLGYSFRQIAAMIEGVDDKSRVGVCIDTAHAYAAGYNIATDEGYEACWEEFEREIGFEYLRGMHINDSQKACGSRVDRDRKSVV